MLRIDPVSILRRQQRWKKMWENGKTEKMRTMMACWRMVRGWNWTGGVAGYA
jgi:hypothetical protein